MRRSALFGKRRTRLRRYVIGNVGIYDFLWSWIHTCSSPTRITLMMWIYIILTAFIHLHAFGFRIFIVPLYRCEVVSVHTGESDDDMGTERWVDVCIGIPAIARTVLAPVDEVTNSFRCIYEQKQLLIQSLLRY